MTKREKQSLFVRLQVRLVVWATTNGYELTDGESYRPPETAEIYAKQGKGIKSSLHCERLAKDWNLFKQGKYLTTTEAHRPLGEYWKSLDPLCAWGGDFKKPDGGHYSLRHGKRR
jgi:hypothetical protein